MNYLCFRCGQPTSSPLFMKSHLKKKEPCDVNYLDIPREEILEKVVHKDKRVYKIYHNEHIPEFEKLKEKNFARIIRNLFEKSYSNEDIIEGIIIPY